MNKNTRLGLVALLLAAFAGAVVVKETRKGPASMTGSDVTATDAAAARSADALRASAAGSDMTSQGDEITTQGGGAAVAGDANAGAAIPRLVDLGSTTCIPCKMMAPILEDLAQNYRGQFDVEVIDVRENRPAAQLYGVRVIPTQIFYDAQGVERFRHEGFLSKEDIMSKWKELGFAFGPSVASPGQSEG